MKIENEPTISKMSSDRTKIVNVSLTAIVASAGGVIGRAGSIPWKIHADMRHFQRSTVGGTVIMGRKTYESIGRPLKNRTNIVVSRSTEFVDRGVVRPNSTQVTDCPLTAIAWAHNIGAPIYIIGGAEIYNALRSHIDRWIVTEIDVDFAEGADFTLLDPPGPEFVRTSTIPQLTSADDVTDDGRPIKSYSFVTYERANIVGAVNRARYILK